MSKIKSAFFCAQCGHESAKWLGKCPSCGTWNSFTEEVIHKETSPRRGEYASSADRGAIALQSVDNSDLPRMETPDDEMNRVLGGGIVRGSITLVAGEPGIGKSTLFLQMGLSLQHQKVLYVSGEESVQQVKLRATRIEKENHQFYILPNTNTQAVFAEIKKLEPDLVIVDSIQTMESPYIDSAAGSISQIKECAAELQRFAKESNVPVFLIGHITKDGSIAGPKILEHMVDTVLQFEGDRHYTYRILRTLKNRFGSTSELGIYEMTEAGMRPVSNPSEILISQKEEGLSGSAIAATLEGQRPLLVEVQALVTQSVYGTPQRTVTGFDMRRLQLLLAVLEKRGGFLFGTKDVFLNIAGGLRIEDPSIDLAVAVALLSSFEDIPISHRMCFAGELGLNGEVRPVNRIEQRISEAARLGFEKIFISSFHAQKMPPVSGIEVVFVSKVGDVYQKTF
jgi:DNA repair protein RadA/Sms